MIKGYIESITQDIICDVLEVDIPRFETGDAKAVLPESVRGRDVYILVDVGNFRCKYNIWGCESYLSPDEHYQNLVRTISAVGGKAKRINVIMPFLYAARQDRRILRESLDCAVALQQLEKMGVANVMAIDVHDVRVQNAVPFMGFDNLMPTYQMIKTVCNLYPDIVFDEKYTMMVSPDFGGMNRNFMYANELGIDMGVFYKRRDLSKVKDGANAILTHKYIGPAVEGKDVLIIDDIIASGDTLLDSALKLKELGARRIFMGVSYALFTRGTKKFDEAYDNGILNKIFVTNASFVREEISGKEWYQEVDVMKYIAYYIYCVSVGDSVSKIMNPHDKICELMKKYKLKNI